MPALTIATRRVPWGVALGATLLSLAAYNVVSARIPHFTLVAGPVLAVALLVLARRSGLTWAQLGLARSRVGSGVKWGLGVVLAVAAVYCAAIMIPAIRPAFLDARYHLGALAALQSAFLIIPLGTVLLEEIAFRSVLWGMFAHRVRMSVVAGLSAGLFGLWHVLPSLGLASANQGVKHGLAHLGGWATFVACAGVVVFTAIGGIVAGELRRRSGHLLASVGMHWATNSLGVLFGLLAWHLT